jgi:phosphotransferase system  glucose/maltose/N-acetylglucosamine-specific IIC component
MVITGIILIAAMLIGISKKSVETYLATLEKMTKKVFAAVFTLLALLIISSFQGKFEADQVKKEHIYSQTSIRNKTGNIVSNDTIYFIGKTNDYVFFYNGIEKSVQVYPMSEIAEIIYKTKTKY